MIYCLLIIILFNYLVTNIKSVYIGNINGFCNIWVNYDIIKCIYYYTAELRLNNSMYNYIPLMP